MKPFLSLRLTETVLQTRVDWDSFQTWRLSITSLSRQRTALSVQSTAGAHRQVKHSVVWTQWTEVWSEADKSSVHVGRYEEERGLCPLWSPAAAAADPPVGHWDKMYEFTPVVRPLMLIASLVK